MSAPALPADESIDRIPVRRTEPGQRRCRSGRVTSSREDDAPLRCREFPRTTHLRALRKTGGHGLSLSASSGMSRLHSRLDFAAVVVSREVTVYKKFGV